jgi:hypothetical protein
MRIDQKVRDSSADSISKTDVSGDELQRSLKKFDESRFSLLVTVQPRPEFEANNRGYGYHDMDFALLLTN